MAIALPVTSLYFGIHAVVFGLLSLRVGLFRNSVLSKGKPAEEYPEFKAMSAAQNNFAQYMPVIFLALTFMEVNSIFSTLGLYALGAAITAARLSHAAHLTSPGTFGLPFRVFGFISTVVYCVISGVLISLAGLKALGGTGKGAQEL